MEWYVELQAELIIAWPHTAYPRNVRMSQKVRETNYLSIVRCWVCKHCAPLPPASPATVAFTVLQQHWVFPVALPYYIVLNSLIVWYCWETWSSGPSLAHCQQASPAVTTPIIYFAILIALPEVLYILLATPYCIIGLLLMCVELTAS